jgi:hypothetical protein
MIVHQRWAIAILRVKSIDVKDGQAVVRFHEPENHLEFAHPWPQPIIGGEKGNSSFCLTNALELLDQPVNGSRNILPARFTIIRSGAKIWKTAEVIIPALETLVTIDGTSLVRKNIYNLTELLLSIPPGCVLLIRDTSLCKGDFLYWMPINYKITGASGKSGTGEPSLDHPSRNSDMCKR